MINLNIFSDFYLNLSNLEKYIKNKRKNKKKLEKKSKKKLEKKSKYLLKNESEFFKIKKNDQLFWCFYIFKYGLFKYETINNDFIEMNEKKYFFIEELKKNKKKIKELKFNIKKVEENLSNYSNITINTIISLCYTFDYNFCIFDEKICYYLNEPNKKIIIIKKNKKNFEINLEKKNDIFEKYLKNKYIVENNAKPLKSISSYKLKELQDICKKMNIDIEKKKKKDLFLSFSKFF